MLMVESQFFWALGTINVIINHKIFHISTTLLAQVVRAMRSVLFEVLFSLFR